MNRRDFLTLASVSAINLPCLSWARSNVRQSPSLSIPRGYVIVADTFGVPAAVLFGVALQESSRLYGQRALPYPWTLNIQRQPHRFPTYHAAVAALKKQIANGVRNIDCGLMQVNWGYHADKLGSPANAIDPYPNLRAGAAILQSNYRNTGNWHEAVGRYHSPQNRNRANRYADQVFKRMGLA